MVSLRVDLTALYKEQIYKKKKKNQQKKGRKKKSTATSL